MESRKFKLHCFPMSDNVNIHADFISWMVDYLNNWEWNET